MDSTVRSKDPESKTNKPEQLAKRFKENLEKLGNFMAADKVEYQDLHKKEVYVISKGKKRLTLTAQGNTFDGGYLKIE